MCSLVGLPPRIECTAGELLPMNKLFFLCGEDDSPFAALQEILSTIRFSWKLEKSGHDGGLIAIEERELAPDEVTIAVSGKDLAVRQSCMPVVQTSGEYVFTLVCRNMKPVAEQARDACSCTKVIVQAAAPRTMVSVPRLLSLPSLAIPTASEEVTLVADRFVLNILDQYGNVCSNLDKWNLVASVRCKGASSSSPVVVKVHPSKETEGAAAVSSLPCFVKGECETGPVTAHCAEVGACVLVE